MRKISTVVACLLAFAAPAQASWLYCKLNPADCAYIQGELIPFDKAEILIEDCRSLTWGGIGARAMSMSTDQVMKITNGDISHPLLRAQLAYMALHDSPLKFDRSIAIERRYPHVRTACAQAFADWNR